MTERRTSEFAGPAVVADPRRGRHLISVVGAGVSGLSTALALTQAGYRVEITSGRRGTAITSAVAAAFWYAFRATGFRRHWAAATYFWLRNLVGLRAAGASAETFREYFVEGDDPRDDLAQHGWWATLPGINFKFIADKPRTVDFGDDPLGRVTFGSYISFDTVVIRMPTYLSWLERRLASLGVAINEGWVASLPEQLERCDAVVNCGGYAAARLDPRQPSRHPVEAVSGQVARVPAVPLPYGMTTASGPFRDEPLYIVPRASPPGDVILGGSTIVMDHPTHSPLPEPDPQLGQRIVRRCRSFFPRLASLAVQQEMVGLRPVATPIRVARDDATELAIFHNYGHGGSGLTLSWGAANRIVDLVDDWFGY
jgi:D-amino-acid oxidase